MIGVLALSRISHQMKECQQCKACYTDDVRSCPKDGMPTVQTIAGEPVLEGKYHLETRIGQGGMGVVYKARHAYLKTQHAIKIILPDLVGNDPQLVTRFRQEALAAAAIRHPNVVGVTDYGVIGGTMPYLVMEYVEGESLHDLLIREQRLTPEYTLDLMSAICSGVGEAHRQGIVHRDLKPLNIMICTDRGDLSQSVKILDFGLAKIKSGELLGSFIQAQTQGLMGSPYYMAPEQWSDDEPDPKADVYSLGVMLFQVLTGDVPFKGSSIPAIMKKHLSDAPPSFFDLGIQLPAVIERAVLHALAKDPLKRTSSVAQLSAELTRAIAPNREAQIHSSAMPNALPVSSINITTRPARSSIFVDSIAMGESREDGSLLIEGIQSGNHHLRISHNGFRDWSSDLVCDGRPQNILAELKKDPADEVAAIPRPDSVGHDSQPTMLSAQTRREALLNAATIADIPANAAQSYRRPTADTLLYSPGETGVALDAKKQRSGKSTLFWGIAASLVVLGVVVIGSGVLFLPKMFGGHSANVSNGRQEMPIQASSPAVQETSAAKPVEMVLIPGGTFQMGNDAGPENEKPVHSVTVQPFWMDKTEVTNEEYFAFVTATGRENVPTDWVNRKPLPERENFPVRFVSYEDAEAFAAWRSKRDAQELRLPTEAEWEFAARNGTDDDAYPWGDSFKADCAVVDRSTNEPLAVGSHSCPNKWGVVDLIGNVFEWTSSPVNLYPGSKGKIASGAANKNMVRGGAAYSRSTGGAAATSTLRADVDIKKQSAELGFRLVRKN